jgi:hypothetical protein
MLEVMVETAVEVLEDLSEQQGYHKKQKPHPCDCQEDCERVQ